jgi:hypothetical protein
MCRDIAAARDVDGEVMAGALEHLSHPVAQGVQIGGAQRPAVTIEDRNKPHGFLPVRVRGAAWAAWPLPTRPDRRGSDSPF